MILFPKSFIFSHFPLQICQKSTNLSDVPHTPLPIVPQRQLGPQKYSKNFSFWQLLLAIIFYCYTYSNACIPDMIQAQMYPMKTPTLGWSKIQKWETGTENRYPYWFTQTLLTFACGYHHALYTFRCTWFCTTLVSVLRLDMIRPFLSSALFKILKEVIQKVLTTAALPSLRGMEEKLIGIEVRI